MGARHISYGSWFLTVLAWDGLMPACVVLLPLVISALLPQNAVAIEIIAVALPIAAFFIRGGVGARHIASNNCPDIVRIVQYYVFCFGIFLLVPIDCALILSHLLPKGALFANRTDRIVWSILFPSYLVAMTIAMYPGRKEKRTS